MPFEKLSYTNRGRPLVGAVMFGVDKGGLCSLRVPGRLLDAIGASTRVDVHIGTGADKGKIAISAAPESGSYCMYRYAGKKHQSYRLLIRNHRIGFDRASVTTAPVPHQIVDDMLVITLPTVKPALAVA